MIRGGMHPLTIIFHKKPHFWRQLPYLSGVFETLAANQRNLGAFFERQISLHMKQINDQDWDTPATDYVEAYLKEKARREASGERHDYT